MEKLKYLKHLIVTHKIHSVFIGIILLSTGYYSYGKIFPTVTIPHYEITKVTIGNIEISVSGTGQVIPTNQIDIKPEQSGRLQHLSIKNGDKVKAGDIIGKIDSKDAEKQISDNEISLSNAQIALSKMTQPPSQSSLIQAENAVNNEQRALNTLLAPADQNDITAAENTMEQATRDLEDAKNNYNQIQSNAILDLQNSYDYGYTAVSNTFLQLPQLMNDLKNVRGTDAKPGEYIGDYELILGDNSIYIINFNNDYGAATALYDANVLDFQNANTTSDNDTKYQLISETLNTVKIISKTLEDVKNMFDAIELKNYKQYSISSVIDAMYSIIQSDISTINGMINTLQSDKDTIDTIKQDLPINLAKAQNAIDTAQETLGEKKNAIEDLKNGASNDDIASAKEKLAQAQANLDELKNGTDPLDIKSQKLTIQQRTSDLADAKNNLLQYYIKANFDGIITNLSVQQGDVVSSSTAIATLLTENQMAQISLNEVDAAKVKVGQKAILSLDAIDGLTIDGQVAEIDTIGTVSQGVVSYNVKISLNGQDERIKPGMSATVQIIIDSKENILLVPTEAIKSTNNDQFIQTLTDYSVYKKIDKITDEVTSNERPQRQTVETGLADDNNTEITSGLKEGDSIVLRIVTTSLTNTPSSASPLNLLRGEGGGNFRAQ
ncbi:MAG: RND family efflux transporter MFP subunit, HlyD family secretion protein [Candidatus Peregrinibacteria bacterium GW2011_GWF2_33_10]|nr:MAG: RND family efflux transporter MFP subunit, HlyD family secretion protein [Candidatus Peregrinibacteria bacterium GW2011_GWF2_33_10]OGJ44918.1 MAG: hypothetical protein A2263_03260 [Candidatus Peregrinibacteria bacterium RIFOXYA2_FULL_33_21]OGJ50677.1 MAG: hypothetical protein A2307_03550 [Candidatus Peregrinibacteria bacterium RIFOXYB2_FULL_33_20]